MIQTVHIALFLKILYGMWISVSLGTGRLCLEWASGVLIPVVGTVPPWEVTYCPCHSFSSSREGQGITLVSEMCCSLHRSRKLPRRKCFMKYQCNECTLQTLPCLSTSPMLSDSLDKQRSDPKFGFQNTSWS